MPDTRILAIDDEELLRVWLQAHLREAGYSVSTAGTLTEARESLSGDPPDAMILDLRLPDGDGIDFLSETLAFDPEIVVIVLSAHGDIGTAVQAVRMGAFHFLEKPCLLEDLLLTLEKGLETRSLKRTVSGFRRQSGWQISGVNIVGKSGAMAKIMETVGKVAESDSTTVLVRGESGVGKEVIARAIHASSSRCDHPFLEINCTALPESLIESELFGFEQGAFTDARQRKLGLFELAHRGTVLLDEIGDLPLGSQAKILRFLETRSFKRVGGITDIKVDVRIIASTNRDLEVAIAEGTFRHDLFYRLDVVPIELPPLRDRVEDIEPLARHFLHQFTETLRKPLRELAPESIALLKSYPWPGNVRELKNVLERTVILEDAEVLLPRHLPELIQRRTPVASDRIDPFTLPATGIDLDRLEEDLIRQALERTKGVKSAAARLLGLSRDTLRYRIEKYGLEGQGPPES